MTSKIITITSKNQITLPAELVRKYKLDKNRRLSIRPRGDELVLKPEPTLDEIIKTIQKRTAKYIKGSLTDEELKQSIRRIAAERGNR